VSELVANDWFRVTLEHGVGRVTRLPTPPPPPTEMATLWGELGVALRAAGVRRLLLDLRGGPPGRNDPEFERAGESWRRQLATDFDRIAILVRTAVGKRHVQRLGREAGRAPAIFMSEAEALTFLSAA
jgi:hypothetical protein